MVQLDGIFKHEQLVYSIKFNDTVIYYDGITITQS